MTKGKVLIAAPVDHMLPDGLVMLGYEVLIKEDITQKEAAAIIDNYTGIITSTRLILNKELLQAASRLKWIGRMGSGMEIIDVAYAEMKGISCFSSPEGNCNAVAEHAVGMLLALNKKIVSSSIEVRNGEWIREPNRGMELEGKTIGIIGFGHTGRALARKLSSFDMRILVYDKYSKEQIPGHVQLCETLDEIYRAAEFISFHVPLTGDTFHYFNEDFVQSMDHPFVLVNTSRGEVVATDVLFRYLQNGKIKGCCLDVLEGEPLDKMPSILKAATDDILKMHNVIITPHIAGYSREALLKMSRILLERIVTLR